MHIFRMCLYFETLMKAISVHLPQTVHQVLGAALCNITLLL